MKYWRLVAAGVTVAAVSLATIFLLRTNDPSRGVFVLGDKRIQIEQNEDGSVQWDGRIMTCDEIIIVLHETEKNCGKTPAPFDRIHFGPFICPSSPPTPEELAGRFSGHDCPPHPIRTFDFFMGNSDALIRLRDFASQKGLVLEVSTLPDRSQRIPIAPTLISNPAYIEVFKEAQSGRLGMIGFGAESRPPAQAQ